MGAIVLLRRPSLWLRVACCVVLPQVALVRHVDAEGIVGSRYFLPVLPLVALLSAAPIALFPVRSRLAATVALAALALATTSPPSQRRYTFQDEHAFLRDELARASGRCRVFHVAVHDDPLYVRDADCCLEPSRSPLVLAAPGVEFEPLDIDPAGALPDVDEGCALYYESAICRYGPTEHTEGRNPGLSSRLRAACESYARDPRLEAPVETSVTAHGTWPFFSTSRVPVRLFRVRPGPRPRAAAPPSPDSRDGAPDAP
jgi:hypothetical protein